MHALLLSPTPATPLPTPCRVERHRCPALLQLPLLHRLCGQPGGPAVPKRAAPPAGKPALLPVCCAPESFSLRVRAAWPTCSAKNAAPPAGKRCEVTVLLPVPVLQRCHHCALCCLVGDGLLTRVAHSPLPSSRRRLRPSCGCWAATPWTRSSEGAVQLK